MKRFITKLWKPVRRNPVINAFLFAVVTQIGHDFFANQIDWTNIVGYLAMVGMAVMAREFTVPNKEHQRVTGNYKKVLSKNIELQNITEGWPRATVKPETVKPETGDSE